jgi:hypothetical protein
MTRQGIEYNRIEEGAYGHEMSTEETDKTNK